MKSSGLTFTGMEKSLNAAYYDNLFLATAVKAEDCHIPEDRPGIYERLKKMEESIKNQNKVIQNLQALELNNRIVQLVYGLTHAKIIEMVPNCHEILKYKHSFRFEDVLNGPNALSFRDKPHGLNRSQQLSTDLILKFECFCEIFPLVSD